MFFFKLFLCVKMRKRKNLVIDDRFWEKNIMGENISVTKIKHLEKFMQNIPLNIFFKDTECK